jgi:hypothetical protein
LRFTSRASASQPGKGKIWFGLDDVPVSSIKGNITSLELQRQRDAKGRFLPASGSRGATFTPASSALHPVTYLNSFSATLRGKSSVWIREGNGHVNEARVPVYAPMVAAIDRSVFPDTSDMLMSYFTKDLKGRVAGNAKGRS